MLISELILILEKSSRFFEVAENKKLLNKTNNFIGILNTYSDIDDLNVLLKEATNQKKQQSSKIRNKFDYNLLYEIFLKLRDDTIIEKDEQEYVNRYLSFREDLTVLIDEKNFEWFYEFENKNEMNYTTEDFKLIYRIINGYQIKKQNKTEIISEIKNSIYQIKYHNDVTNRFDKNDHGRL